MGENNNNKTNNFITAGAQLNENIIKAALALGTLGLVGWIGYKASNRYIVSSPTEYVLKTGVGIPGVKISKNAFVFPFQNYRILDITPKNYKFTVCAMTQEKMEFQLPGVFTIGPYNDLIKLNDFSERLATVEPKKMDELINGIIEGETRLLAANMTIEQIFSDRSKFKDSIRKMVQEELEQFGLKIFNANVKELQDHEGSEYFTFMRQKTREGAMNQSRIEVAEARKTGQIGEKTAEGICRMQVAKIEADTIISENENEFIKQTSNATLKKNLAELQMEIDIAKINAEKATQIREEEMKQKVEQRRFDQLVDQTRADELSKIIVEAEKNIKEAEGYSQAEKIKADVLFYQKQKEAEGITAIMNAQAAGLTSIRDTCSGDKFRNTLEYLMVEKGMYTELANANAKAIQGLNPKITVWNTGTDTSSGIATKAIRDIYQTLPPLFDTVRDQTGMNWSPPSWIAGSDNTNKH